MTDAMNQIPIPNVQFKIEEIDGETLLYHLGETKTVYLNETATVIWQLCDGERTAADIIALLQNTYLDAAPSIADDVLTTLDHFAAEGAVSLIQKPRQAAPSDSTS